MTLKQMLLRNNLSSPNQSVATTAVTLKDVLVDTRYTDMVIISDTMPWKIPTIIPTG